jgi:hypothetical protein
MTKEDQLREIERLIGLDEADLCIISDKFSQSDYTDADYKSLVHLIVNSSSIMLAAKYIGSVELADRAEDVLRRTCRRSDYYIDAIQQLNCYHIEKINETYPVIRFT